jgi:hypothetical protein
MVAPAVQWLGYGLHNWGSIRSRSREVYFSLHHHIQTTSGTHPVSYPMGTGGSFPEDKQLGHEAAHSRPSSPKIKNVWSYTSTPPYVSMVWSLIKHRDDFTFTFNVHCVISIWWWSTH